MSNNNRLNTDEFYSNIPGQRTLPNTYIDYSPENVGNAFALKDAVPFGDATDTAGTTSIIGRLGDIQNKLAALDVNNATTSVLRGVNSNSPVIQIKPTTAFLKSIYVDNLGASTMFLTLFQGNTVAPVNGDNPLESYRIPANATVSITFNRNYTGQVFMVFSSTAGAITASTNLKNYIVTYN